VIADQPVLVLISIVLAFVIVLVSRLPRSVIVLFVTSILGAFLGLVVLVAGGSYTAICDYFGASPPGGVDTCGGRYWHEMRLPQFMQGPKADAWMIGIAIVVGILAADALALVAMFAWRRVRGPARRAGVFEPSA
jgi:hypothetical protein